MILESKYEEVCIITKKKKSTRLRKTKKQASVLQRAVSCIHKDICVRVFVFVFVVCVCVESSRTRQMKIKKAMSTLEIKKNS